MTYTITEQGNALLDAVARERAAVVAKLREIAAKATEIRGVSMALVDDDALKVVVGDYIDSTRDILLELADGFERGDHRKAGL